MYRPVIALAVAIAVGGQAVAADLFTAAGAGDLAAVERLLAGGAAVDAPGPNAETPLTAAALAGRADIAERLLAGGADVQARNAGGFTPLHAAAYSGSLPVAVLLLDRGARLDDAGNKASVTPLMVAAEQNHPRLVELLIARGAAVATPERDGYVPLTRALWRGNDEVMRVLKQHGATCQPADIVGSEELYQQCLAAGS
jgi:ankyrin repeat protein